MPTRQGRARRIGRADRACAGPTYDSRQRAGRVGDDSDVAVTVRTTDGHAELAQLGQQQWRRVTVVVVQPHRDDRQPGMHRAEEASIGVSAAVVRHLEHVGPYVDASGQHGLLRLDLGIAGQEHPDTSQRRPHDQRRVVRIGPRTAHGPRRSQELQVHGTGVDLSADDGRGNRQAVPGEHVANDVDAGRRLGERTGHDGADLAAVEYAVDTADVVEVVVAEDQQRDVADVQVGQAPIDGHRVRPRVDDHGAA
jgi:hypothetical protein